MLTPTDIHYIVGLLCNITSPDNVEIILGDLVRDTSTGTERDVDVTITYKDSAGKIHAFIGMEVKAEKRPLDIILVEQLCAKYRDMPDITEGGIVSASGYTAPAIKKAKYHGIELYELREWDYKIPNPEGISFHEDFTFMESHFNWLQGPHVAFNYNQTVTKEIISHFNGELPVFSKDGSKILGVDKLSQLSNRIISNTLHEAIGDEEREILNSGNPVRVDITIEISDEPYILVNGQRYALINAKVNGTVESKFTPLDCEFKMLVKHSDENYRVGCIIGERSPGDLVGIVTTHIDNRVAVLSIGVSERLKKKIFKQRIS